MAQNHKSQCLSERRRPERGAKWPYKNWPPCERWPPARFTTQHSGIAGLSSLSTGLVWLTTGQQAGCLCACVCQSVRMCVCVFSKCVTRKIKGFLSVTHIKKVSSGLRTPKLHIVQAYRGTHTHTRTHNERWFPWWRCSGEWDFPGGVLNSGHSRVCLGRFLWSKCADQPKGRTNPDTHTHKRHTTQEAFLTVFVRNICSLPREIPD